MNKSTKFYGIDISAAVFDVTDQNEVHHQFTNDFKGFNPSNTKEWEQCKWETQNK